MLPPLRASWNALRIHSLHHGSPRAIPSGRFRTLLQSSLIPMFRSPRNFLPCRDPRSWGSVCCLSFFFLCMLPVINVQFFCRDAFCYIKFSHVVSSVCIVVFAHPLNVFPNARFPFSPSELGGHPFVALCNSFGCLFISTFPQLRFSGDLKHLNISLSLSLLVISSMGFRPKFQRGTWAMARPPFSLTRRVGRTRSTAQP